MKYHNVLNTQLKSEFTELYRTLLTVTHTFFIKYTQHTNKKNTILANQEVINIGQLRKCAETT